MVDFYIDVIVYMCFGKCGNKYENMEENKMISFIL